MTMVWSEETIFRTWLWFVAATRAFAIINGYINLKIIRDNVYPHAKAQVSDLFGRMFSNWTILSVALVSCLALYPTNKQVYVLNLVSFSVAFGHMVLELFKYRTMAKLSASLMAFFSLGTSAYMITRYVMLGESIFHDSK